MGVKSTGVVRQIDQLGRIVIPKEIRRNLDVDVDMEEIKEKKDKGEKVDLSGGSFEIYVDYENERLILQKYSVGCKHCGRLDGLVELSEGFKLCEDCIAKLNKKNESKENKSDEIVIEK
ncbi:MAG: AbrB family transcriptional regulator [archaeon]